MVEEKTYSLSSWILLVLIGASMTFSTLHSHHHMEWDHSESDIDTGHCLVENTNVCPVCGYLFNAETVEPDTQPSLPFAHFITEISDTGLIPSQSDQPNGRSPPALI